MTSPVPHVLPIPPRATVASVAPLASRTASHPAGAGREAAAQFAALLYASAFAPVAKALGFYGDVAVAGVAASLARAERGGLTDRLEAALAGSTAGAAR